MFRPAMPAASVPLMAKTVCSLTEVFKSLAEKLYAHWVALWGCASGRRIMGACDKLYAVNAAKRSVVAMARAVQVPDIRKVDLPEARQAIPHVHAYLRQC